MGIALAVWSKQNPDFCGVDADEGNNFAKG
jgi:hypothetical protein